MGINGRFRLFMVWSLVLALVLSACSGPKESPSTDKASPGQSASGSADNAGQTAKPAEQSETKRQEPLEISWLVYQSGEVSEDSPTVAKVEETFNVKMDIWNIDLANADQELGVRFASGNIPDMFVIYGADKWQKYLEQGIIQGITMEELAEYMPNLKKMYDETGADLFANWKHDGMLYGIPAMNNRGPYLRPIVWNKQWLDKVGLGVPETLEQFEEAMVRFRNGDPDGDGQKNTYGMSVTAMMNVYGAYGVNKDGWTLRDGKVVWSGILPETKEALATLARWKAADLIDPEWVAGENTGGYWAIPHHFINGRIGVTSLGFADHWYLKQSDSGTMGSNVKEMETLTNGNYELAFGKPPVGPDGKSGNIYDGFTADAYITFGANAGKEEVHTIMTILDRAGYTDFDDYLFYKFGIEGVHYDWNEARNGIVRKEGFQTFQELSKLGTNTLFTPFYSLFYDQTLDPKDIKFMRDTFVIEGGGHENILKAPLPSSGQYWKNLTALQEEVFTAIINGNKPVDSFDQFVQNWLSNGGEQLTKEANQWYASLQG